MPHNTSSAVQYPVDANGKPYLAITINRAGYYTAISGPAAALLPFPPQQSIGRHISDVLPDNPERARLIQSVREGTPFADEIVIENRRWFMLGEPGPMGEARLMCWLLEIRDPVEVAAEDSDVYKVTAPFDALVEAVKAGDHIYIEADGTCSLVRRLPTLVGGWIRRNITRLPLCAALPAPAVPSEVPPSDGPTPAHEPHLALVRE